MTVLVLNVAAIAWYFTIAVFGNTEVRLVELLTGSAGVKVIVKCASALRGGIFRVRTIAVGTNAPGAFMFDTIFTRTTP